MFAVCMTDFVKAFNHVNFYKLISKMLNSDADPSIVAAIATLFMAQKVFFKIGDNLSKDPIRLSPFSGHQGSIGMPPMFLA